VVGGREPASCGECTCADPLTGIAGAAGRRVSKSITRRLEDCYAHKGLAVPNADDQGHFNRPKLPAPSKPGPDEATLVERVKKSMEIDAQRGLWSRRIRSIQILSGIVIVYFSTCRRFPCTGYAGRDDAEPEARDRLRSGQRRAGAKPAAETHPRIQGIC
jgi:hypothetical protein